MEYDMTVEELMKIAMPFLAIVIMAFFAGLALVIRIFNRRREAKKVELPHTMNNDEYARLNKKRFGG